MKYTALQTVNLRREPRVVEYKIGKNFITNRVGQLDVGTQREILETTSNKKGETWGRVSETDPSGIAVWVCVRTLNTEFMRPTDETPQPDVDVPDFSERVRAAELVLALLSDSLYEKAVAAWVSWKLTPDAINSLVAYKWLTPEQGKEIKSKER